MNIRSNRRCFELRNIPLETVSEGVEVVDGATPDLVRLQHEGAAYVKVP